MSVSVPAAQDLHAHSRCTEDEARRPRPLRRARLRRLRRRRTRRRPGDPRGDLPLRHDRHGRRTSAWIQAAIDEARPEARQLIDDVDGMVTSAPTPQPGAPEVGLMRPTGEHHTRWSSTSPTSTATARSTATSTVLHELGHVIDYARRPAGAARRARRPASVHRRLRHRRARRLHAPAERFADTFAKWALRGAVSARRRRLRRRDPRLARGLGRAAREPRDRDPGRSASRAASS